MSDITANIVVSMPSQLFTMARSFKAVANGKIYIGQIDTDPVDPANQIPVYLEDEDGSHVQVAQPIVINMGGYPVYNGQISKFVTVQGHSMAVYDASGVQQFYFPNVLKYDPDQLEQRLSEMDGDKLIGECPDIATLRTIEPTFDKQRITLREHTANTGKGGGQFRAVLSGANYSDNNGTIVKTSGGAAWLRIDAYVTNPLMFGALCDSSVSDHAALMAASDAAEVMDGLGLTYYVNSTVLWNFFVGRRVRRNFKIRAMESLPDGVPIVRTGNLHFTDNFTIDGSLQTTGTGNFGITWEGGRPGDGGGISNGDIRYTGASGIYISGDYSTLKFAGKGIIDKVNFVSCGTRGSGNGRVSLLTDGINNFTISNIVATDCNWGVYIRNDFNISGVSRASGNTLLNLKLSGGGRPSVARPDAQGISASYQENLKIDNVTVNDFADNAIDMQYCNNSIVSNWRASNCKDGVFMGDRSCQGHRVGPGVAAACDRAVRFGTAGDLPMQGQTFLSDLWVSGVRAISCHYEGFRITLSNISSGATVRGVTLEGCNYEGGSAYTESTQEHGFVVLGASDVRIVDCQVRNVKKSAVFIQNCNQISVLDLTAREVDREGTGWAGVYVLSSPRTIVNDAQVTGSSTATAIRLGAGSNSSAIRGTRWGSVTSGVVIDSGSTGVVQSDNVSW